MSDQEKEIEKLKKQIEIWKNSSVQKAQKIKDLNHEITNLKNNGPQNGEDGDLSKAVANLKDRNEQLQTQLAEKDQELQTVKQKLQDMLQARQNDPKDQEIYDLKKRLDQFQGGGAKALCKNVFDLLNKSDQTQQRIDFMSKIHEWHSLGDELAENGDPSYSVKPAIDTYMEQRENFAQIAGLQTDEAPELLQAQLETVFFGPIDVQQYPTSNLVDQQVSKQIESIHEMLVTELICLQNIRANSEKFFKEGDNKKETMNEFQKRVIGRMMRRTLNQIPAYKLGSKKPEKSFELQKLNLNQLLMKRQIKNMSFTLSSGRGESSNDLEFSQNIFKFIEEYDDYVRKLKKEANDARD